MITLGTGPQRAGFTDVRAANLALVLGFVRAHAPCSRADIAAATGLTKATVSSLIADLIERRLVRETGLAEHRIGRPATMLMLDGEPYVALGMEINAAHLAAVAIDVAGERALSWRRSFAGVGCSPERAVTAMAGLAQRAVARLTSQGRQVLGLTVGVPGLVDDAGTVLLAPNLGWRDVPLRAALARALQEPAFPVVVDNDANLAVVAEHRHGRYAGTANLAYLGGEAGISAGVVVDDRPLRGGRGLTGEIGHLQIHAEGPPCRCGRSGCLEALAGVDVLVREALAGAGTGHSHTDLASGVGEVIRRARAGERTALDAIAAAGRHLGHGASVIVNLFDPQVVVFGGYYAPFARWLLPPVEAELAARAVAPQGDCRIVASTLGRAAAATGGAARVLDTVDAGQLPARITPGSLP